MADVTQISCVSYALLSFSRAYMPGILSGLVNQDPQLGEGVDVRARENGRGAASGHFPAPAGVPAAVSAAAEA
jgi:hypothetical protein